MTYVRMGDEIGTLSPVVRIVRINGDTRRTETMRFVPYREWDSVGEFADDPALPEPTESEEVSQ